MLSTLPFADPYPVTVILNFTPLLENCAFFLFRMSCLHIRSLIQNSLMVMMRLYCAWCYAHNTTPHGQWSESHPVFICSPKEQNSIIAMLLLCLEQNDFEIKDSYKYLMSPCFCSLGSTLLRNSAANGKFKAAENEAVLSINKTKSCEF